MGTVIRKTFDELAAGHRVQTWDGITGTVVDVEFIPTKIWNGELVNFEARVQIHSGHLPTFDSCGWPKSFEGTITRTVRKYGTDLHHHYAIEEA